MNLNSAIKQITDAYDLDYDEVLKLVYDDIEHAISLFREEIRLAENVETLLFLRRSIWEPLFAENTGTYYTHCKRSPMLKILRFNADIRYCELLERKRRNEHLQVSFRMVESHKPILLDKESSEVVVELDGELVENEIVYSKI